MVQGKHNENSMKTITLISYVAKCIWQTSITISVLLAAAKYLRSSFYTSTWAYIAGSIVIFVSILAMNAKDLNDNQD
jgi:hypothetical protein